MLSLSVFLTALLLGVRHAFDADHITAVDNVTRRLVVRGERPTTVGTWFALGHSAVVFAMAAATIAGAGYAAPLLDEGSLGRRVLGVVGALASVGFLLLLGLLNLRPLVAAARGEPRPAPGWLMRRTELVRQPWQMFFIGLLFGLGFDTASEIALLVLAATAAASGASIWLALAIPVCFAAGMTFFDTLDGWLMARAYRSAVIDQDRERWYNLAVTGLSVLLAFGVGVVELISLLDGEDVVNLEYVGYAAVGLFALIWFGWRVSAGRDRASAPR